MHLLQEIGPDQKILAFAFNLRNSDGTVNSDLELANRLNRAIYQRLSIDPGTQIYGYDLIVSTTDLDGRAYGAAFIADYKRRQGVAESSGDLITVIRSVVMDPWVAETSQGSFIDILFRRFRVPGAPGMAVPRCCQSMRRPIATAFSRAFQRSTCIRICPILQ